MASWQEGAQALADRDPVLAAAVSTHGLPRLGRRPRVSERYEFLARSIVFQQISTSAARSIWARVEVAHGGPVAPASLADLPHAELRAAGLSEAKALAVKDLTARVLDGSVDLDGLGRRSDDEVIAELSQVRGIGVWTAQMFLISGLRRIDVWPAGDMGVRAGWSLLYDEERRGEREFLEVADHLAPYRSIVAWYCWQEVNARRSYS